MDMGSLEFLLDKKIEVNETVMAGILYQILWGLGYLHYDNRLVLFVYIVFMYTYIYMYICIEITTF
jgi:hypothetical protein